MNIIFSSFMSFTLLFSSGPSLSQSLNDQVEQNEIIHEESIPNENLKVIDYETGVDNPYDDQTLTYTSNEKNEIIGIEHESVNSIKSIAVTVRTIIVGYLSSNVIDGVVISVTGQSGAWWFSQALSQVLNKVYVPSTTIDCNVFPPYSYEGAKCRSV